MCLQIQCPAVLETPLLFWPITLLSMASVTMRRSVSLASWGLTLPSDLPPHAWPAATLLPSRRCKHLCREIWETGCWLPRAPPETNLAFPLCTETSFKAGICFGRLEANSLVRIWCMDLLDACKQTLELDNKLMRRLCQRTLPT